jgi:hypothetical protein
MPTKVNVAFGLLAPLHEGQLVLNLSDIQSTETITVTTSGATTAAAASGPRANLVRVSAVNGGVHIKAAATPTATTADVYIPIGTSEVFFVQPGDKVAAIED